jgi:hypothetical protein
MTNDAYDIEIDFSPPMGMVAYPILWYYRSYQKKLQASRVSFEGAPSATFPTQKYKGCSSFIKGKN